MASYTETVLFLFVLSFAYELLSAHLCELDQTVDITAGNVRFDNSILFEESLYTREDYFKYNNQLHGCVCNLKTCIPKCCPKKHILINGKCEYYEEYVFTVNPPKGINLSDPTQIHFLVNRSCVGEAGIITAENIFGIYEHGYVELSFTNITDINDYCIEANEDPAHLILLVCLEIETNIVPLYNSIGMSFKNM